MTDVLMKLEKHTDAIREVEDEIDSALKDPGGLGKHQRRLAFMISFGIAELIEIYFHKLKIMKQGSRIKHDWLKKKTALNSQENQIIKPIDQVKEIENIIKISKRIEEKRNDLAYSSPVEEDEILKEEINGYFRIKRIVEIETGDIHG